MDSVLLRKTSLHGNIYTLERFNVISRVGDVLRVVAAGDRLKKVIEVNASEVLPAPVIGSRMVFKDAPVRNSLGSIFE